MNLTITEIKKKIVLILKRNDVKRAAIFGSFARGEATKKSGIDILIEYKNDDKSLFDLVDLQSELKKTLKRKVDLLTYDSIYHRLRENILSSQKIIL